MGLGDNGNSAITGWQYVKKVGSGNFETTWNDLSGVVESGTDWPKTYTVTLTGLTNDTAYQFKVRAKNTHGDGTASPASNSLTPVDLTLSSVADQSWVKDIAKTVTLPEASGGRTPLTYSVLGNLPSGLSFDGSTRALSGTATTVASATTYTYKVRDADGSEDTDAFTIEVTNATPTLSGTADQSWVKDIAKTVTLPEASGGDAPLTYSVVGDLPSGLSFNASTRQLSGTASAVASATTYTYKVRDANGDEDTDLFTVAVTDATPTLPDVTAQSWVKDIAKTVTLPEASGGDAPLTYSVVGDLPSGLSFNASTRQLSGTASAVASATTYTYKVRDANGDEDTDLFTVAVTDATPTLPDVTAQSWVKDIAKTVTLPEASGGDAPLTYSVVGDLPSGLSFNASTRQLSGTASAVASATTYTYKVRDANGDEDTDLFTVAVTDATPTLPDVTAQSWVKDIAKTVTLPEASGGDAPLTYSVVGDLPSGLSFNASTRQLSGTASAEASATTYTYKVRDANGDEDTDLFTVAVTDATPTLPDVTAQSWVKDIAKTVTLPEASGGDTPLTYSVVGDLPSGLSFNASTRQLSGTASAVASATTYTYKVRDANGDEDTDLFTVAVTDATPTLPDVTAQSWVKDIAKTVTLPEASGGDAPLTYSVVGDLPSGLSFNASTRQLSGTASAVASATTYTYKVRDANGDEDTDLFTVAVTDATPTLPDVTAQSWVKDIAKTVTLPEASGGDAPLTYSVVGSLPSGLSFNASTRQLSGTASAEASATTYTYKVRDANGDEDTDLFTVAVTDATPTLPDVTAQSWVKDIAKTVTLPEASGGDAPLTYSVVGSLPSGLSFNASTRQLSGTASAEASATTYTYKVRDANGDEDTDLFTVAVTDATPTLPDVTAQSWVKDIAKTVTLPEASGGDAPLTYSVVGSLPSGLSFNASTRQLSGTASTEASATTYTYKVEDANGDEDTDEFTIAVTNEEVTIPSVADQSWLKGVTVAVTLPAASSGDTPLTYSLAGSLPAGVSFNAATRVLSGTPSGTQTATTYTYKVEDKNGDEDTDEFTVAVTNEEVTIPSVADQSWLKGVTVAVTLPAASSGDTPLTYSLLGSLPVGVSFNAATRVLSGTPSGTQTATTYTYKVEDKNGDEDTDAFTLEVTNATPALSGTANQSWVKDIAKTVTLPASAAGDTPLTYSLLGNLPTGLSFDSSTRVLSGTATTVANATTYTYKVEDKNGDEDTEEFTLEVTNSTPALSSVSNKTWVKDVPKTVILPAASGGDAPLTYSVPGSLPTGLSFNSSSRTLSGTVSAAASPATYTYKVRDANGDEFTVEFTVEVLEQSGASDDQSEVDDSDPCALVPQDMVPTQPTLEGVPFLPAGPALASSNAELRVRLPSARTNALAPVLAWNFKLDHYKDESQLGTWTSVPEVWHMERAIAVTVLDSQAQPAASGVPAAAEDLARDLLFSRTEVPVARGSAASYAVRLATQPTADVTVTVAGPSESVGGLSISPAQLTFSASNWNHSQVVTVTAPAAEGEYRQATIGHTASGGGYDGVSGQVTAQETDASAKALTMSANELEVGEGSTVTYTLHLAAKPSSDVVLTIARTGQAGLSVDVDPLTEGDQNSLTFTPTDWNVVRPIAVTAGPDENATDETAQLEHALSGDGFGKRIGGLENATSSACDSIYLLSVQAVNRLGASAYSTAVQATPTTVTPAAPANLQAEPGAGKIALSWSDPADDSITGYEYRYTTYSGTSSESRGLSAWQALEPTTQHVVQGMRFGVRYTFEVRALQDDLRGAVSRATAIPALVDAVSRAPTGFAATWTAAAEGQLRWDADSAATSYQYRYSADDGASWTDWQDAVATCDEASCSTTVTVSGNPEAFEFELRRRSILNPDIARARTGTHPSAPKAPLLVASNPVGPTPLDQWQLTWTAATDGEPVTGWQYRSVYLENASGSLWSAWTDMQPSTDEGVLSFTVMIGSEDSKGQRMFQVRGTNSSGVGEPSNAR